MVQTIKTTNHGQAYNRHPWISTNKQQPITGQEIRQAIPACKCETRQAIPACKVQTSYPSMHRKGHCIKGAARAQKGAVAVGVRRAQYKKTSRVGAEPATTTLLEARQGTRHEA